MLRAICLTLVVVGNLSAGAETAPAKVRPFTLKDVGGKPWALERLKDKKAIVVVFIRRAAAMLPAPGSISGTVFQDINVNGVQDVGEPGIAGQTLFLDLSGSGKLEAGDPTTTTDGSGNPA